MTHILKHSCDLVCLTNVRFDQEATKASLGRQTTLSLQEWAELVLLLRSLRAAPELLLLLPFPTESMTRRVQQLVMLDYTGVISGFHKGWLF